jgi:hypothetical protein
MGEGVKYLSGRRKRRPARGRIVCKTPQRIQSSCFRLPPTDAVDAGLKVCPPSGQAILEGGTLFNVGFIASLIFRIKQLQG